MAVTRHLTAWHESVDQALAPITPLGNAKGEDIHRISGDDLKPHPQLLTIHGAYVAAVNAELARFNSPSLRAKMPYPYISPLSTTVKPGIPPGMSDLRRNSVTLSGDENMQLEVENDSASEAQDVYGLAWFGEAPAPVQAQWQTIRLTPANTALVAGQWKQVVHTLDNDLLPGSYEIGGVHAIGADLIAARFLQRDSIFKPGCLAWDSVADVPPPIFRYGNWGTFGTFRHDEPPTVEYLANGVNPATELYLDVRRV